MFMSVIRVSADTAIAFMPLKGGQQVHWIFYALQERVRQAYDAE